MKFTLVCPLDKRFSTGAATAVAQTTGTGLIGPQIRSVLAHVSCVARAIATLSPNSA
jgi:hypothetical protein